MRRALPQPARVGRPLDVIVALSAAEFLGQVDSHIEPRQRENRGARLPAGTAQTGQENRPLSDGRFSVFSGFGEQFPPSACGGGSGWGHYTRSILVNNQPNFPLITAASQKGQMLVMSTLTAAPQFGHACAVIVPGRPVSVLDGR